MKGTLPTWLENLLGVDPAESGEGTVWGLDHSWAWAPWVTLLFVAGSLALVLWIYLREGRTAGRWTALGLALLRLLAIGVVDATGKFKKGDVVCLRDPSGAEFARGLINYSADEVLKIKGLKTDAIAAALGQCPYHEVIHRDNIALTL